MRNISTTSLNTLFTKQGIEPIMVVKIIWNVDHVDYFADKIIDGIQGKISSISGIEEIINLNGNAGSTSISVILDDSDGYIKNIINTVDPHKKPVQILQYFSELPFSEAFIIFEGLINSPITWREGDRTFSFDVISRLEDNEVGFSVEEGLFEYVPPELIGKAWPLVFGTVNGVQSILLNDIPAAITAEEAGLNSENSRAGELANRFKTLQDLQEKAQQAYAEGVRYQLLAANLAGVDFLTGSDSTSEIQSLKDTSQGYYNQYTQYSNEYVNLLREFVLIDANAAARRDDLLKTQIRMINGRAFPRNTPINVRILGINHVGMMIGETFVVQSADDPYSGQTANFVKGPANIDNRQVVTEYATEVALNRFFYMSAGSIVEINGTYPLTYIVGLTQLAVTSVIGTYKGFKVVVPNNYYSIQYRTYGSVVATFLVMPKPLSSIDSSWSNDIETNVVSSIGPSMIDIMVWLIQTYTQYDYDPGSFGFFREYVDKNPASFALTSKPNVFQLLNDIAFQARCAIWLKNGIFYIKYLPLARGPVGYFSNVDIIQNTFEIFTNNTEELVTKMTGLWKSSNVMTTPNKIIFRYNIKKYGSQEQTYDFFCFNNQSLVEKALEFWLIRKANTWKMIRFSCFLDKLHLEMWDTVTFDLAPGIIANGPVDGIITRAVYDSNSNTINIEAWLPIRMGEMSALPYALPSSIDISYIYPIPNDNFAGSPNEVNKTANGKLYNRQTVTGPGFPESNMQQLGNIDWGRFQQISDEGVDAPPLITQLDGAELIPPVYDFTLPTDPPYKQYVVKSLEAIVPDSNVLSSTSVPGFINSKESGSNYFVDIYPNGLDNPSSQVLVRQLTIDEDSELTPGIGVLVLKIITKTNVEYVMQAPIWTIKPEVDSDEAVPPPDPGIVDGSEEGDGSRSESADPPTRDYDDELDGDADYPEDEE